MDKTLRCTLRRGGGCNVVVIERDPGSLVPWFPGPAPWAQKKKTSPEQAAANTRLPRRRPTPANNLLPCLSLLQPAANADNVTPCALVSTLRNTPPRRLRSEPRAGGALVPEDGRGHRGAEAAGALAPRRPPSEQAWAPESLDLWLPGSLVSWLLSAPLLVGPWSSTIPGHWAPASVGPRAPGRPSPSHSAPSEVRSRELGPGQRLAGPRRRRGARPTPKTHQIHLRPS